MVEGNEETQRTKKLYKSRTEQGQEVKEIQ
jgi:hypothetical protein